LGLTVGCARCHNHKFDPIPQGDYYAMKAIFEGVQHGERALRSTDYEERSKKPKQLERELAIIEGRLAELEPLAQVSTLTVTGLESRLQPVKRSNIEPTSNDGSADRLKPGLQAELRRSPVNARLNVDRFAPTDARF